MQGSVPIVNLDDEEVENAKLQTAAQKFAAGAELFDFVEAVSSAGIRMQNPDFTTEQVHAEFLRRMRMGDEL